MARSRDGGHGLADVSREWFKRMSELPKARRTVANGVKLIDEILEDFSEERDALANWGPDPEPATEPKAPKGSVIVDGMALPF